MSGIAPDGSIITGIKGSRLPTPRGRPAQNGRKNHLLPSPLIFQCFKQRAVSLAETIKACAEEFEQAEVAEDLEERSFTRGLVQDDYPRRILSWRGILSGKDLSGSHSAEEKSKPAAFKPKAAAPGSTNLLISWICNSTL